jgi:hypothetical protein
MKKVAEATAALMLILLFVVSISAASKTQSFRESCGATASTNGFLSSDASLPASTNNPESDDREMIQNSEGQNFEDCQSNPKQEDNQNISPNGSSQAPVNSSVDQNQSQDVPIVDGRIFLGGDPPYGYIPTYSPKGTGLPMLPLDPTDLLPQATN